MGHILQFEMPVIPLQRSAVDVDGHGRNDVGAPCVRDIERFDAVGRTIQSQQSAQCFRELGTALLHRSGSEHFLCGILIGQMHQFHLRPPLGREDLHFSPHRFCEHPGQFHLFVDIAGQ